MQRMHPGTRTTQAAFALPGARSLTTASNCTRKHDENTLRRDGRAARGTEPRRCQYRTSSGIGTARSRHNQLIRKYSVQLTVI